MPTQPVPPKQSPADPKPANPKRDSERETREAVIEGAGEDDGRDRDLMHGDGGTVGLGPGDDLNHDD